MVKEEGTVGVQVGGWVFIGLHAPPPTHTYTHCIQFQFTIILKTVSNIFVDHLPTEPP